MTRDLNLGPAAASGSDLLPLAARPSHPGARLKAMRDARARREREAPRPFDADRLRDDLRALENPGNWMPGHDGDLAAELRRRGWTDDRLAAARDDLQGEYTDLHARP